MKACPYRIPAGIFLLFLAVFVFGPVSAPAAEPAEKIFEKARDCYWSVLAKPKPDRRREDWELCLERLAAVTERDEQEEFADRSLYLMAQSYHNLYDLDGRLDDFRAALRYYKAVVSDYPESPLADDAQYLTGVLHLTQDPPQAYLEFIKVELFFPEGDMAEEAQAEIEMLEKQLGYNKNPPQPESGPVDETGAPSAATGARASAESSAQPESAQKGPKSAGKRKKDLMSVTKAGLGWTSFQSQAPARLSEIQHWSAARYTRVVLYVDDAIAYTYHTLRADRSADRPDRIYLDLEKCELESRLAPQIPVGDGLLKAIRTGQHTPDTARVVLDLESVDDHRVFSLADPFRIVVDVMGERRKKLPTAQNGNMPGLAQQLGLGVQRVVIDPGHGGRDPGAISADGLKEKDVVLKLAKFLKRSLEKDTGVEVVLTRKDDRHLSLEERTAIANTSHADLFVSLHINANEDHSVRGFQSYYLSFAQDEEAARLAAFENATSTKQVSDLETILHDLMLNAKVSESSRLATEVQKHMLDHLQKKYDGMRDMGVRHAPFYVLLGAEMPSVLLELGFISNEKDARLLADDDFRGNVAQGVSAGLKSYIELVKKVAGLRSSP
jgi:N-acetylmuramoyl-L-alanine amidase